MPDRLMDLFIPICLENVGTIFAKKEITLSPKSYHSIQMRIEPLFKLPVLLVLVFSGSLIGATFALGQSTISVQAGGSFTTWGGDDVKELEDGGFDIGYRTGVAVRASVVSPLTDLLGLQIGAAYVQKGASGEVDEDDFYLEFTTDMDYLEFPLLLRFSPQLGGPLSPHVAAGPAFSFVLNCRVSNRLRASIIDPFTGEQVMVDDDESEECEEDVFKTFDFGVMAGAGLAFAVSPSWSLTLDLTYNHGLSSIIKVDDDLVELSDDTGNRTFAFMAGVAFRFR